MLRKPTSLAVAQAAPHAHRRHPSAPPAVVVQPTKTPGLLSISKPAFRSPQRHMPSQQRTNSTARPAAKQKQQQQQQPLVARAPALLNPAEISHKKPALPPLQAPASPTPQHRGRGSKHAREKAQQSKRTSSHSPVRGKHSRQPSPPLDTQLQQQPPQAEATSILSSNQFDPFLDNSDLSPPKTPTKFYQPRQSQQLPSPPLSESIPVPRVVRHQPHSMSRSEPKLSHMPPPRAFNNFPICDDMTDVGDISEAESPGVPTPPATPLRKQVFADKTSLVNAPLSTKRGGFSFTYPSPPPSNKGRRHRRTPSEGVFNMSSDEDVSSGPNGFVLNQNLLRFARTPNTKAPTTPSHSLSRATGVVIAQELDTSPMGGQKPAGYFASSLFQNSPSPDELPDPMFF